MLKEWARRPQQVVSYSSCRNQKVRVGDGVQALCLVVTGGPGMRKPRGEPGDKVEGCRARDGGPKRLTAHVMPCSSQSQRLSLLTDENTIWGLISHFITWPRLTAGRRTMAAIARHEDATGLTKWCLRNRTGRSRAQKGQSAGISLEEKENSLGVTVAARRSRAEHRAMWTCGHLLARLHP